jgi:hypothetical protein
LLGPLLLAPPTLEDRNTQVSTVPAMPGPE